MRLRSIQVLRGIAAMAVVAHHAFDGPRLGAAGVDLFFVISGFIMATCTGARLPGQFLADRAWRIYPLWLIAVAPWIVMNPESFLVIVRSITLWPVYGNQFLNPALGVGWTLSFELLFYAGFALALATRATVPLIIFCMCLILGLTTNHVLFWYLGSPLALEFLLGVAVARIPRLPLAGVAALALGIVGFAMLPAGYYDQAFGYGAMLRVFAWGIPSAMLLYGAWSLEKYFADRTFDIPVLVGGASYSIYLFHQLVLKGSHGLAGFILSGIAGVLIYLSLERYIMRAKPRWRKVPKAKPKEAVLSQT